MLRFAAGILTAALVVLSFYCWGRYFRYVLLKRHRDPAAALGLGCIMPVVFGFTAVALYGLLGPASTPEANLMRYAGVLGYFGPSVFFFSFCGACLVFAVTLLRPS